MSMEFKKVENFTEEERAYFKENLKWENLDDYVDVRIDRNKEGKITYMKSHERKDPYGSDDTPNLMDIMKVAYAAKTGKRLKRSVRSKFTESEIRVIKSTIK